MAVNCGAHIDPAAQASGDSNPLIGDPEAIIEEINAFIDAGATRVSPDFSARVDNSEE